MSDDSSEFITNASQIETVSLASLPKKPHVLKGLKRAGSGKDPKVMVCALSVGEYDDYREFADKHPKDSEIGLFWWGARDTARNHLWKDAESAVSQIRSWPLPVKLDLTAAINAINNNEPAEVVEGNSDGDQSGSPSSDSATTSDSGTSTGSSTESH